MAVASVISGLRPETYQRSPLHSDACIWPEKNCYVDLWIEILHALGLEPRAMLPFVLTTAFEGDQCTFFKPVHSELYDLYGLDVQELTVWKPLLEHAQEHLAAGRLISTEADAYWLPDTAGTDYRRNHSKTTIVINALDVQARTLDYFHNASCYRLSGEDFDALFRIGVTEDPAFLPLFAEFIRIDRLTRKAPEVLARESLQLLRRHIARRPLRNPVQQFAARFECELPDLQQRGLAHYHLWAFATVRQFGAAFELAAMNVRWLEGLNALPAGTAAEAFERISTGFKSLILKGARSVNAKRPLDIKTSCDPLAADWDAAMANLTSVAAIS